MPYPQLSDLEILQQLARLGTFEETAAERNETVAELRRRIDRLESGYDVPLLAPVPAAGI